MGAGSLVAAFPGAELAGLDAAAAAHGPAAAVGYPLRGRGERFPFHDPAAEAFWLGDIADPVERYRALLEGVAHVERLALAVLTSHGVPIRGPLRTAGGGSRSTAWLQIRATVTGLPIAVPAVATSGFGAAVLAAAGTVHSGLQEAVCEMVRTTRTVEPVAAERAALDESYHSLVEALIERGYLTTHPENGASQVLEGDYAPPP